MKIKTELLELLEKYDAFFSWDPRRKVWSLEGPVRGTGLGWWTDDFPARDKKQAMQAAIQYLEEYHRD